MRILKIRLQNLNSLVGEWQLDLTHPAFANDGLFAITGPTGAGKSTLLDAICLALYGRTPRLARVGKAGNEIMSRQTGECFAEVTFVTQKGEFRCHWSQHRARRKAGGELQTPKHELSNAVTGEIVGSNLRDVAAQVTELTGLDFDRFTRSMLLAQGSFAAFLQASADERAPLLEQITGTEIYSRISIEVHERRSHARKHLEVLQAGVNALNVLTPEDEHNLRQQLHQHEHSLAPLQAELTEQQRILNWFDALAQGELALQQLAQQEAELAQQQHDFAADAARLKAAQRALELAADHAQLLSTRSAQQHDAQHLARLRGALPSHTASVAAARQATQHAASALQHAQQQLAEAAPKLHRARELDVQLREQQLSLQRSTDTLQRQSDALLKLRAAMAQDEHLQQRYQSTLAELQHLQHSHAGDALLLDVVPQLQAREAALQTDYQTLLNSQQLQRDAEAQRHTVSAALAQARATAAQYAQTQAHSLSAVAAQQQQLEALLDGHSFADLRQRHADLVQQQATFARALNLSQQHHQCAAELETLSQRITHDQVALEATQAELTAQEAQRDALSQTLAELEASVARAQRVADFAAARQHLHSGEACPLCGALEHPFAEGQAPAAEQSQAALLQHKAMLAELNARLHALVEQRAEQRSRLSFAQAEHAKLSTTLAETRTNLNSLRDALDATLVWSQDTSAFAAQLSAHETNTREALHQLSERLRVAEEADRQLKTLHTALETTRQQAQQAEHACLAAEHAHHNAEQACQRNTESVVSQETALRHALTQLSAQLQQHLADAPAASASAPALADTLADVLGRLAPQLARLSERRQRWQDWQHTLNQTSVQLSEVTARLQQRREQVQAAELECHRTEQLLATQRATHAELQQQRHECLGDRNADAEERRLQQAVDTVRHALSVAQRDEQTALHTLAQTEQRLNELHHSCTTREHTLSQQEADFCRRLAAAEFTDEASWQAACLPAETRTQLSEHAHQLQLRETALHIRARDARQHLNQVREQALSEQPRDVHAARLASVQHEVDAALQTLGELKHQLQANEARKAQVAERLHEIDAHKQECERWDQLHELIGSADGKKFRNFAQGLTFERMIGHANRQLALMSDRYALVRDRSQPLDLNVVDHYQAGEVRSTRNLSGGESFLVSLALALGLSHMASQNVRVDSLFLDEGFGTLDEDALDVALSTLGGLQQEGKLIGIISHVAALKERISTQIQVRPLSGGRSQLSGPGCSRRAVE